MQLQLDRLPSPIGNLLVLWDNDEHLRAIDFEDFDERMRTLLRRQVGACEISASNAPPQIRGAIESYFAGDDEPLRNLPVRLGGSKFQRRVWTTLQNIPSGTIISYGELAKHIGQPTASRAVGLANGANPIAIRIPCHRVIGANGRLTGYGGGLWRKEWLLAHEDALASQGLAFPRWSGRFPIQV
ncbi:MAG: methylated-DNA--[protein]-cysteine S-methyltransferase [Hyphomicrobiaceae bacterium]|nr:methylated-DNA--[protein]-cysteine S-methyltransferase [Hyphomicrobiaceae bacterium]